MTDRLLMDQGRRKVLKTILAAASLPLAGPLGANAAYAAPTEPPFVPGDASLLLGGNLASIPGQFGELAESILSRGLGLDTPIQLRPNIEQDGVTAANLFDANEALDGATALAAPHTALLAALIGDTRVHYDYGRWIPLMLARTTTIVIGRIKPRVGLRMRIEGFFQNRSIRLAVSHPTGNELSTLLGLSLLGMRPTPVPGFTSADQALGALKSGAVDAIQISPTTLSTPLSEVLATLPADTAPLFQTGDLSDLQAEQIPNFLEAYQQIRRRIPTGPLYQAWQGVSAANNTALTLALPMLTPPRIATRWQRACTLCIEEGSIRHWANLRHFSLSAGDNAAPLFSRTTPPLVATLSLRRWIAINTPRWRAGQDTRNF